ncbi:MAG: hypothetical protein AAF773_07720 [Cyanobacteria bacterium P01_D01_bin.115]
MTTFATADIPNDVTTIEQLHAWSGAILELNNGANTYPETIAGREYVSSIKRGRAQDGTLRQIHRHSFELVEDYQTRPVWKQVKEFTNGTIPAEFKVAEA